MDLGNMLNDTGATISIGRLGAALKLISSNYVYVKVSTESHIEFSGKDATGNDVSAIVSIKAPTESIGHTWKIPRLALLNVCELAGPDILERESVLEAYKCSHPDDLDYAQIPDGDMIFFENGIEFSIWFDEYSDDHVSVSIGIISD